jgi:hypothetical protein
MWSDTNDTTSLHPEDWGKVVLRSVGILEDHGLNRYYECYLGTFMNAYNKYFLWTIFIFFVGLMNGALRLFEGVLPNFGINSEAEQGRRSSP